MAYEGPFKAWKPEPEPGDIGPDGRSKVKSPWLAKPLARLEALRERLGVTKRHIDDTLGLAPKRWSTIIQAESYARPEELFAAAGALGASFDWMSRPDWKEAPFSEWTRNRTGQSGPPWLRPGSSSDLSPEPPGVVVTTPDVVLSPINAPTGGHPVVATLQMMGYGSPDDAARILRRGLAAELMGLTEDDIRVAGRAKAKG